MHHTTARIAIAQILNGRGFGERGLALVTAAALGDADEEAQRLRRVALARAGDMPSEPTISYGGPLLFAAIPADERQLCDQLCPELIASPCDVGMQLACLSALVNLWPHVGSDERSLLRSRFLDGLAGDKAPPTSVVSSQQLRIWQRDLPTAIGETSPSLASLKGMLHATSPQLANRVLAEHLGMNSDSASLSWVLGALSVQLRLNYHDLRGQILHVLQGTVACDHLSIWAQPEHLMTLIAQLAHQMWWCRQQALLPPIRTCLDVAPRPLAVAVLSGDLTVAQRAARAACAQPLEFWHSVWQLLEQRINHGDAHWYQALHISMAIAFRTSSDAISPDDAAALGTVFAELAYREKIVPEMALG